MQPEVDNLALTSARPRVWANLRPQFFVPTTPRELVRTLRRQFRNLRVGFEYRKHLRQLPPGELDKRAFSGPHANSHIRPAATPKDGPLNIYGFWGEVNSETDHFLPGLQPYGRVTHYNYRPDFQAPFRGEPDWDAKERMQQRVWEMASAGAGGKPYDVLFFYTSGALFSPDFVRRLRSLGIPMINFGWDDVVWFEDRKVRGVHRGVADIAMHFTAHCTTTVIGFHKTLAVGGTPYYFPGAASPQTFRRLEGVERDLDVVVVGAKFYDRGEIVRHLNRHGIAVHAYGPGWPNGRVSQEEHVRLLNRAKIVLGFNRYSGTDWVGVKGRDHEVPMTGAFHLVNEYPELPHIYTPGAEVGVYRDRRDLVRQVRRCLAHPEERDAIAAAGRRRALKEHTFEARFGELFRRLGLIA